MPAVKLSRVGAHVVDSGPGGEDLAANTWQRLEALPDPRSPQGQTFRWPCGERDGVCQIFVRGDFAYPVSFVCAICSYDARFASCSE